MEKRILMGGVVGVDRFVIVEDAQLMYIEDRFINKKYGGFDRNEYWQVNSLLVLLNNNWGQTVRFEKFNKEYLNEFEKLFFEKKNINNFIQYKYEQLNKEMDNLQSLIRSGEGLEVVVAEARLYCIIELLDLLKEFENLNKWDLK